MRVDYRLCNRQAQARAAFVKPARFVRFMKPVKNKGYFVGAYALARIEHRHIYFSVPVISFISFISFIFFVFFIFFLLGYFDSDKTACRREFYGVFKKILQNPVNVVGVRVNLHFFGCEINLHFYVFFGYFLLEREKYKKRPFAYIKVSLAGLTLAALQLSKLKRICDKPRKPAGFLRKYI